MSHHNNSKRQRQEEEENDNVSINSSMDNTAIGDAKDAKLAALESKNALLEAKNEILQGKLENQELRAKIRELAEENAALKQTTVEQIAQIENNEKFDEFMKQQKEEMGELKTKIQEDILALRKMLEEADQKAQLKLKDTIQVNELRMESMVEGMTILKEEQKQLNKQNSDQMKPENLWNQLIKAKRFEKAQDNRWNRTKATATISHHGLQVSVNTNKCVNAVAIEGFAIAAGGQNCRKDHFPGTIIYYYEMTQIPSSAPAPSSATPSATANWQYWIGLSSGSMPVGAIFGQHANSYVLKNGCDSFLLSGKDHSFGLPTAEGTKFELNSQGDVIGCGLVLSPKGEVAIFFTGNGTLLDKQIPITPSVDRLYPTVFIWNISLEANFGDDQQAKPFKYDIEKCPGMEF